MIALQQALGDRYVLQRTLGRGGMGIVYLARETALDRLVALKILPPSEATGDLRQRFLAEARIAANLQHDNIVPIHAVGTAGPYAYYTMEYIRGETLFDRIIRDGPLPAAVVTRILHEVALAVHYAHEQGVVHRDLKPNNILIEDGTGTPHVVDFGIARLMGDGGPEGAGEEAVAGAWASDQGAGRTIGTLHFSSPEQLAGLVADRRSDIYALGLVGFMMAAGEPPFDGTEEELIQQHLSTLAPELLVFGDCLDTTLAEAVARCLAKDPDARFQTAKELADFLAAAPELTPVLREELQTFVTQLHSRSESSPLGAAAGLTGLMVWGNALDHGRWLTFGLSTAFLLGLLLARLAGALLPTYRLVKQGYGRARIIHALLMDLRRQFGPEAGKEKPRVKLLRAVGWGAFFSALGTFGLGSLLALLRVPLPEKVVVGGVIVGALFAAAAGCSLVILHRKVSRTERWLRFFEGWRGRWMVRLARILLKAFEGEAALAEGTLLDEALSDPEQAARRLAARSAGRHSAAARFVGIVNWSESCVRRARVFLDQSLDTRTKQGRAATPEEEACERALEREAARLEELRGRFVGVTGASAGTEVTADLKAAWAACQVLQELIKAQEWRLLASKP
ncbi:MAG TPA: serine/threonine-protein kinase [Gemmatimonadales bacterium]|nr:serine/threonine-protein kinase [Gemmatimonadales bacterium]